MAKRKIILVLGVCAWIALLAVQSWSQADNANRRVTDLPDLERLKKMTEVERQKYLADRKKQRDLERKQRAKESKENLEQIRKRQQEMKDERDKERKEAGGPRFLSAKRALGVTEEQWRLIKPKLEKVRDLQGRARSTVILSLGASSASGSPGEQGRSVPTWQWNVSWKDKDPNELTEAQKIADRLMALVDRDNTTEAQFRRTMEALRNARREESQIKTQLAEARRELRDVLTTRQEAALVLMNWL